MAARLDTIRKVRISDVSCISIFMMALIFTAQVIAKGKGGIQCAAKRYELQSEQVKDASLHPSWEASRRRKEQESKRTPFEGQRTVFSDSD